MRITVYSGEWIVDSEELIVGSGEWIVDSVELAVDNEYPQPCQWLKTLTAVVVVNELMSDV